jgi:DNA-binding protein
MDKYRRVEKPRPTTPIGEYEIRITTEGMPRNYLTYAIALLEEKGASEIILKGLGNAITNTVTTAEIIKRRIPGLHQNTQTSSVHKNYNWEPLEDGLQPLETTRHVSMITITLSKIQLSTSSPGYQAPPHADQLQPLPGHEYEGEYSGQNSRARGRGLGWATGRGSLTTQSSQNGHTSTYQNSLDNVWHQGRGRGGGRGCGLAVRGRGRGFFGDRGQYSGNYNNYGMGCQDVAHRGRGLNGGRPVGNANYDGGIDGSGRFANTGNRSGSYGIVNRGRARGRGSFGAGNQNVPREQNVASAGVVD